MHDEIYERELWVLNVDRIETDVVLATRNTLKTDDGVGVDPETDETKLMAVTEYGTEFDTPANSGFVYPLPGTEAVYRLAVVDPTSYQRGYVFAVGSFDVDPYQTPLTIEAELESVGRDWWYGKEHEFLKIDTKTPTQRELIDALAQADEADGADTDSDEDSDDGDTQVSDEGDADGEDAAADDTDADGEDAAADDTDADGEDTGDGDTEVADDSADTADAVQEPFRQEEDEVSSCSLDPDDGSVPASGDQDDDADDS